MKKIYLSDSGPKVSEAVYGFWRWDAETENAPQKMERIVNLCLELGINTFDHADIYGHGLAESWFGDVIAKKSFKREDIVLFTKCGISLPNHNQPGIRIKHYNTSREHIKESLDNSLKRLKTDYIDIFLLDHLDPLSNLEETAITLAQLKESGKVKNIGVANFTVFQHQLLASVLRFPIVTNHIELNLLQTEPLENGQLDYIKQRFMRPLASSPLAGGDIANSTDHKALAVRSVLEKLAPKYNADIESLAVAWIVSLGAIPLIGTTNEARIHHVADAFNFELDRQDWYQLYAASTNQKY
ncbi:MAG: aldo/keto reductase [Chitinophagaceae bacterium]|uniref:aldo/keto reductase n=1 Tax=unclassified Paraflavitalea TaxID=2798305 RepID=UPI003D32A973|nr:aldo/keto reductase [Chitinophagaceae bacterium]